MLRRARARVRPQDVGLPAGARRRVPGLRREEVAQLAQLSVDYVVRLEQGRGPRPSAAVLAAVARALRLDVDERDQLFHLAGTPPPAAGRVVSDVRPSVLRLLDRLGDLPVVVLDAIGTMIAWNDLASALLGDFSTMPPGQRNLCWQRFLGPPGRVAADDEEREQTDAQTVAGLRAAAARYPEDPDVRRLVRELRTRSPRFEALWAEGRSAQWRSHRKTVAHPELGLLTLDCDTLHVPDCDQALIVYSTAPDTSEAEALRLLRVVGTQQLTPRLIVGSDVGHGPPTASRRSRPATTSAATSLRRRS